jgi:uncharacterized protein (TIGR03085 family)
MPFDWLKAHSASRLASRVVTSPAKSFVTSERAELCDLFDELGPDQPTLCEGWRTHDLALHLWSRENDPLSAAGRLIKPLNGWGQRRTAETKRRMPYEELVAKLRTGPRALSPFAIPGVDAAANSLEFFVHHEDVRRAGDQPRSPRELDPEVEDLIWSRLKMLARLLFRRAQVAIVLERRGEPSPDRSPETIRHGSGASIVTLVGRPSELLLFAQGRTSAADVEIIGEPAAVDILHAADLHV